MAKKDKQEKEYVLKPSVGGYWQARGKVTRISSKGKSSDTFRHGVVNNGGDHDGKKYISATIPVTTMIDGEIRNEIQIKAFGMEADVIKFYDKETKEVIDVDFAEWEDYANYKDEDEKNRYYLRNGIRLKVETEEVEDEDGEEVTKLIDEVHTYPTYQALEKLEEYLDKGMSLFTKGRMKFKTIESREGKPMHVIENNFDTLYLSETDIDFESDDFAETNSWNQQICFEKAEDQPKEKRGVIHGRVISYQDTFETAKFIIDYKDDEEAEEYFKSIKRLAKFGDYIYLAGRFSRLPKVEEKKSAFGGGRSYNTIGGFGTLELHTDGTYTGNDEVEDFIQKVLTREDFLKAKKEADKNKSANFGNKSKENKPSNSSGGSFGGKKKDKSEDEDPFKGSSIDIDDDDLPF